MMGSSVSNPVPLLLVSRIRYHLYGFGSFHLLFKLLLMLSVQFKLNVPTVSNKQKSLEKNLTFWYLVYILKKVWYGWVILWYTDPDPYYNVDPELWWVDKLFFCVKNSVWIRKGKKNPWFEILELYKYIFAVRKSQGERSSRSSGTYLSFTKIVTLFAKRGCHHPVQENKARAGRPRSSVPDMGRFDKDPDPMIRTTGLQIRRCQQKYF